jgi:RNA ligase (TIGR02306 family)
MRKLASIRLIDNVEPIPNADAIEVCTVGGWKVVSKKNEFKIGDKAIYCEIDSWIPHALAPFLSKGKDPRAYNDVPGERLRTVKLRGQLSQGLLLPIAESLMHLEDGFDLTELLGIQKWEAPIPAQLRGEVLGLFPNFIPKTDQERIQNIDYDVSSQYWEATEKLDGSSMTVYVNGDKQGVCSRNYDLEKDLNNSFWSVAEKQQLLEKIISTGKNLALQGELIGEGVQKNRYKRTGLDFFLFDIYDIDNKRYLLPTERLRLSIELGINHVPVLGTAVKVPSSTEEILRSAEGTSLLCKDVEREGVVYKNLYEEESFKAISNKFLLKED